MSDEITRIEREADQDDTEAATDEQGDDLGIEAPEADSAEQRAELLQQRDEPVTDLPVDPDVEADPADIAEQLRVVAMDEDEDEERR